MTTVELKVKELQDDIEELNSLLNHATRSTVKQFLISQREKYEQEVTKLKKLEQERLAKLNATQTTQATGVYTKKIDTYGWDQSEKFVKIYITCLKDLNKITQDNLEAKFDERSFDLSVKNLNNINYNLNINNLLEKIDTAGSYTKLKTDMITVFLKKSKAGNNWGYLTQQEMKTRERAAPKLDENTDPQEGLMSMMKKMYEEGDDEMKRTISKAFTESREKQAKGMDTEL
ncbi:unnamed protein product [Brachionus calyciflorus]|uniref:Calcyclin-binding protein n=1 Tax=Brachionus calyciflorus TaxID=104777 RepID=A0A813NLK5_9BILA|nr:unnamed protein product [Brachionus calyciflorus]